MADLAGSNGERTEFNVVGKPNIPGRLSYSIATGKAKFGSDVVVPNMLHAKFLRSPYARAVVKSVDASKAKAIPGVVEIITWEDPELKVLGGGAGMAGAGSGSIARDLAVTFLDNIADQEDEEVAAIVVAEEMGARPQDVIAEFDPKAVFTPVGGGSDGTTAAAWVAKEAAVACKKVLLQQAATSLKVKPEDLDTRDSKVFLKSDRGKSYPFSQFSGRETAATFTGRPPISLWSAGMGKMLDTMNVLFCEVAVDTETGDVEVLKHLVVVDPGKVIRRTSLEGQLHQVMMFSEGAQLSEDFAFDKTTGVKLHTNMLDYKKPTILDLGPVESILLEMRAGNAAYGANGISHSMANTHLIICAIQNAIGQWVDPPATPDRVLRALGKA